MPLPRPVKGKNTKSSLFSSSGLITDRRPVIIRELSETELVRYEQLCYTWLSLKMGKKFEKIAVYFETVAIDEVVGDHAEKIDSLERERANILVAIDQVKKSEVNMKKATKEMMTAFLVNMAQAMFVGLKDKFGDDRFLRRKWRDAVYDVLERSAKPVKDWGLIWPETAWGEGSDKPGEMIVGSE